MLLSLRAVATYELTAETYLYLMVEPPLQGPDHRVEYECLFTSPTTSCELRRDLYGNPQRHLVAPKGRFTYEFRATVEVAANAPLPPDAIEHLPQELPAEAMIYLLPSRFCQSDLLTRMANDEFRKIAPGGRRVLAINEWVRRHVEYRYGATNSMTSAIDTATERIGVCRDFAHLVISFCRALDIPARYASGYALGLDPPDFHGFVQVYLSGVWHNLDATFEGVRPALIPIAVGRDAADVAMTTSWMPNSLLEQSVEVRESANRLRAGCFEFDDHRGERKPIPG
ncbi:transglutaminase family protein [Singulisphaera sp. Ch08]|uniref:Transglutaminase family protein n=1 Tax=Singulisphaera sp. Ch08 TaxID=3120278 RepID=A0AAU7CDJ6_9BACT